MKVVVALLALAGCGGSPPRFLGATLPEACRSDDEPADDVIEVCGGWVIDQLLMTAIWKPHPDRDLAVYVGAVGLRVAAAASSGRDRLDIGFRVIDDEEPQGWSLPGGYVYVSRGALANLTSEAELAALLAHEIAHIAAGHGDDLFTTGGSATSDSSTLLSALEHERDEERQADELAVGYLVRAGYQPQAVATMLVALETASSKLAEARAAAGPPAEPAEPTESTESTELTDDSADEHPALLARVARVLRIAHDHTGGLRAAQRYQTHTASLRSR